MYIYIMYIGIDVLGSVKKWTRTGVECGTSESCSKKSHYVELYYTNTRSVSS